MRPAEWMILLPSSSLRAFELSERQVGAAFEFWVGSRADLESA